MTVKEFFEYAMERNIADFVITINSQPFCYSPISSDQINVDQQNREIHIGGDAH